MNDALPVGLLYQMWEKPDISTAELIDRALEEFQFAEFHGFDSVWVGEHHFVPRGRRFYGRVPHPEMLAATAAATIGRMRFGTGVKVIPDVAATRAAEEMCMLDTLTGGRAEFGLGQGTGYSGVARLHRQELYRSHVDEILELLDGSAAPDLPKLTFDDGERVRRNIWVACRDDLSVTHAARNGLNFVVGQAEAGAAQAGHIRRYREAGGTGGVRGVRAVMIADSWDEAWRDFEDAFDLYATMSSSSERRYAQEAIAAGLLPETPDTVPAKLRQFNVILGSPAQVADELRAYIELTRIDRLDLLVQFPGLPAAATRRSLELFATEVWPQIAPALSGYCA